MEVEANREQDGSIKIGKIELINMWPEWILKYATVAVAKRLMEWGQQLAWQGIRNVEQQSNSNKLVWKSIRQITTKNG